MKNRNIFIATHSALMLMSLVTACQQTEVKKEVNSHILNIKVEPVAEMVYKIPVKVTGILATTTQMKLSFKTGGIINKLNVREGETVKKNDVLVTLDLSEISAQVNQAQIGYEKAKRDLTRAQNLYRDSVATLEQFQNAQSALELAKSRKHVAEFNLKHSRISAPSDGKIQKILVETSEMIGPGYPAIVFASTENDWVVRSALTDKDIVKLSIGDSGHVNMDAFPDLSFKAEITGLGTVADPITGTYEVELRVAGAMPQFRTGYFSRVEIFPSQINKSIVIPLASLLDASDRAGSVFLFEEGKAIKRKIKTGSLMNEVIAVTEGLQVGEMIITDGAKYVNDDAILNAVNEVDPLKP